MSTRVDRAVRWGVDARRDPKNGVIYEDMEQFPILKDLSDSRLIAEVDRLAKLERTAIANLVAAIGEMDARRLYLGQGCSSMFTYCTQVLHLAEHAAYNRIEAARAARRFPTILESLADGRIHLSTVRLLAPHLTDANHIALLEEASHKSKREVEQIIARLLPRPDVPTSVRKLPSLPAQASPSAVMTLGPMPMQLVAERATRRQHQFSDSKRSHSPRGDTSCSSPSEKRPIRSCGARRICCGILSVRSRPFGATGRGHSGGPARSAGS